MCGRYSLADPVRAFSRYRILTPPHGVSTRFNIKPGQAAPVITQRTNPTVSDMVWGLIPHWAKGPDDGLVNIRAETLMGRQGWLRLLRSRRCIVPATSFFLWRSTQDGKVPYLFKPKLDVLFGLAGFYDWWTGPDGQELVTYAIITCPANRLVADISERMPCVLERSTEDLWLDSELTDTNYLASFLKPFPETLMRSHRVSPIVNDPSNDSAAVIAPVDDPHADQYFPKLS